MTPKIYAKNRKEEPRTNPSSLNNIYDIFLNKESLF
jgi:hypothetical protein